MMEPRPPPGAQARPLDDTPASLRKAALYLHGLALADREWLLARLAAAERERLAPLLAELETLGFPGDPSLLEEAVAVPGERTPEETLRTASALRLAAVLRDEPAALVARLLALGEWPWREELLRRLGSAQRRQVEYAAEAATDRPAPALRRALVELVVRGLEDGARGEAAPRGGPFAFLRRRSGR